MIRAVIFCCLFGGFYLLFYQRRILAWISRILKKPQADMDLAARQRGLENRKQLLELQENHSRWFRLERLMYYSGIRQRFPAVTAEIWVAGELAAMGTLLLIVVVLGGIRAALFTLTAGMAAE